MKGTKPVAIEAAKANQRGDDDVDGRASQRSKEHSDVNIKSWGQPSIAA